MLEEFYNTIERLRKRKNTLDKNAPKIKYYQNKLQVLFCCYFYFFCPIPVGSSSMIWQNLGLL